MAKRKTNPATLAASQSHRDDDASKQILEEYLSDLKAVRATGAAVPETSYYPALSNLFNAVGSSLKPKVRCVINIKNQGVGIPDGGLFTADQFQRRGDEKPKPGQLPARGAIEAKGTEPEVETIAASQQVKDYLGRYGIVLVTNLRDFLIVERGPNGARSRANRLPWATTSAISGNAPPPILALLLRTRAGNSSNSSVARVCTPRRCRIPRTWLGSWPPTPATHWSTWSSARNCPPCKRSAPPWRRRWE